MEPCETFTISSASGALGFKVYANVTWQDVCQQMEQNKVADWLRGWFGVYGKALYHYDFWNTWPTATQLREPKGIYVRSGKMPDGIERDCPFWFERG